MAMVRDSQSIRNRRAFRIVETVVTERLFFQRCEKRDAGRWWQDRLTMRVLSGRSGPRP